MDFIKLTNLQDKQPIFINPASIGHVYEVAETFNYGRVDKAAHTVVGTTCHNNGGFKVTETAEQIFAYIACNGHNFKVQC
jgi:hypothetical protein